MQERKMPSAYSSRFLRFRRNRLSHATYLAPSALKQKAAASYKTSNNVSMRNALVFITLVMSAQGVSAANTITTTNSGRSSTSGPRQSSRQQSGSSSSTARMQQFINATCSRVPFPPANKAEGIRYDVHPKNGILFPAPCAEDMRAKRSSGSPECKRQSDLMKNELKGKSFHQLKARNDLLKQKREFHLNQLEINSEQTRIAANRIEKKLTKSQAKTFNQHLEVLAFLSRIKALAQAAHEAKAGNCGEYTSHNLLEILRHGIQHNQAVDLQIVQVTDSSDGDNHGFILINSRKKDVNIVNDRTRTEKFLESLAKDNQIILCDSWNNGLFQPISTNLNRYYQVGWDSVQTQRVTSTFDFTNLPDEAADFLKTEFKKIGLDLDNRTLNDDAMEDEDQPLYGPRMGQH